MRELITFGAGLLAGMLALWVVFLLTGRAKAAKGGRAESPPTPPPVFPPERPKRKTMWGD